MAKIWTAPSATGAKRCIRCSALLAQRGSLVANTDHNPTGVTTFASMPSDRTKRKAELAFNVDFLALSYRGASTPVRQLPKRDAIQRQSTAALSVLARFQIRERQQRLRDRFRSPVEISTLTIEDAWRHVKGLSR